MRRIHTMFPILLAALSLTGASLPSTKPEDVGLSSERLRQIHAMVQRHIDAGDISGAVMFVARKGQIAYLEALGTMDAESKKPMTRDSMFRMASMTKPVIGTSIMMMLEEGKLQLGDPVSKYIPEFKDMKVAVLIEAGHGPAILRSFILCPPNAPSPSRIC